MLLPKVLPKVLPRMLPQTGPPIPATLPSGPVSPLTVELASATSAHTWDYNGGSLLLSIKEDDDYYSVITDTDTVDDYPGSAINAFFDLSSIPADATITKVEVLLNVTTGSFTTMGRLAVRLSDGTNTSNPLVISTTGDFALSAWSGITVNRALLAAAGFNVALTGYDPDAVMPEIRVDYVKLRISWS